MKNKYVNTNYYKTQKQKVKQKKHINSTPRICHICNLSYIFLNGFEPISKCDILTGHTLEGGVLIVINAGNLPVTVSNSAFNDNAEITYKDITELWNDYIRLENLKFYSSELIFI